MRSVGKYLKFIYLGIIVVLLLMVALIKGSSSSQSGYYDDFQVTEVKTGWYSEKSREEIKLPVKIRASKGEYVDIIRTLEQDTGDDEVICFRTDHAFVRAYADGELIYSFGNKEEIPYGKTPGSIWNMIPIHSLKAGTEIRISVMCPYDMYAGKFRTMVQGNRGNVLLYIFKDSCPLLIMCIIPMIVAVFLFVIQIFFYKSFIPLILFNSGCCFLFLTIWSFTEARGWQFFTGNAYVMQMINFVTFSMVIATIAVAMKQMKFIVNEKHFKILLFIDIAIPAGQIVVQLLEIADFFEMLTIIHIMDALNLFVFITDFVIELLKGEKKPKNFFLSVVIYLSTISCLFLDLMDFYVWDKFGNGFFSRIELLIIMMVAGICAVKKSITIYAENIEKKTYERMAYTDDMTHMRNRRAFDRDLENLEQYNEAVTILYADMNGLKQINDCMGHQKGDEAIRTVAEKLHNFQEKGNFCYRIGGDEFCILGSSMSAKEMEQECIRINEELQGVAEKFVYPISIAYGAMDYEPEKNEKIFSVMKMADKRMYEMKEGMKNGLER